MAQLSYWKVLTRRKAIESGSETDSKLHRVMGTFDLTALGVGATLGVGVYVLAGHVAKDQAGPSVILSFAIAAVASLFAGLCYAEFGARVPKAGSAYVYSYVCIGEVAAFVIGWNLILEYIIGSASVARGLSLYLDSLLNNTMQAAFRDIAPIHWGFLGQYFDFFAFASAFLLGIALAFGLKGSTLLNNMFTVLNVVIVLIVIVAGSIKSDIKNWEIPISVLPVNGTAGVGGFFPYGFEGTIQGAATCFFGFVGFDCIATTGEEVKNPRKAIPRAIMLSLLIIFMAYFGVSTVLTLMWPYYLQNVNAPLPYVFEQIGWPVIQWIVTVGGMIGLIASMFGAMFPLPRIMYAMSQDGLIFHFFGDISPRFKTPIAGTICAALLTGLMGAIFDLRQLVNMLSIGTLMAYTVVAISITILRHMNNDNDGKQVPRSEMNEGTNLVNNENERINTSSMLIQIFNCRRVQIPNVLTTRVVGTLLLFYCAFCFGFSVTFLFGLQAIKELQPWPIAISCIFLLLILILLLAISVQPRESANTTFTVPLVPLIPGISIFINVYLMLQLDIYTWVRFAVWMVIGLPMYLICICVYNRTEPISERKSSITYRGTSFDDFIPPQIDVEKSMPNGTVHSNAETLSIKTAEDINAIMVVSNEAAMEETTKARTPTPQGSLDEIILASELSDTVREIKTPNGNTLFIEDLNPTSPSIADEDAKSVIAILDDVLKVEDSHSRDLYKSAPTPEQLPSSIETAAIIHNSFEDVTEDDGDVNHNTIQKVPKDVQEVTSQKEPLLELTIPIAVRDIAIGKDQDLPPPEPTPDYPGAAELINTETDKEDHYDSDNDTPPPVPPRDDVPRDFSVAVNLVSDTPADPAISEAASKMSTAPKTPTSSLKSSRRSSTSSEGTIPSGSSQKFRDRLSKIIINPPTFARIKRAEEAMNESSGNSGENTPPSYPVKLSKSESDLVQMIKASEEPGTGNIDNQNEGTTDEDNVIPKAPKFDPVLYKTVGNRHRSLQKDRPKLDMLLADSQNQSHKRPKTAPIIISEPDDNDPESNLENLPFKEKLAALIKRGPSYRTKIRPDNFPNVSRSVTPEHSDTNSNLDPSYSPDRRSLSTSPVPPISQAQVDDSRQKFTQVLQALREEKQPIKKTKPEIQSLALEPTEARPATIQEALKRLKPIRRSMQLD